MKFWELLSFMRSEREACLQALKTTGRSDLVEIIELNLSRLDDGVSARLDEVLQPDVIRAVLSRSNVKMWFDGKTLRGQRFKGDDEELWALDAFDRFGGDKLEEVLEFGSIEPRCGK